MAEAPMYLLLAEETDFRPLRERMRFAVPQFQTLYNAVPSQRDRTALVSSADDFTDLKRFSLSVAIVDDDAVKLNRRIIDADLQEAIASGSFAYFNIVMVMLAVNMGLAKIDPVCRMGRGRQTKQQRSGEKRNKGFLHKGIRSPLGSGRRLFGNVLIMVPDKF
jgi:hypothetical protein